MAPSKSVAEDDEAVECLNFEQGGNFYIFGELDSTLPKNVIAPLQDAINHRAAMKSAVPIQLFINSCGGSIDYVFTFINLFEQAKALGVEIQTTVYSEASSGAALIAIAGHTRFASESAVYMLHYARGHTHSHNPIMSQRNAKYDLFIQKELLRIIKKYGKITDGFELEMIADNFYIKGGKELKKLGLIDEIL